jgi:hypothetical protein
LCGRSSSTCRVELPRQRVREHVVDERPLAVDLDHGQPFAVASLELGVACDVDVAELEPPLAPNLLDNCASSIAEVAPHRVIQNDLRQG